MAPSTPNNTVCALCTSSIAYRLLNLKKCDEACKGSTLAADLNCAACVTSAAYYAAHKADCDKTCGQAYKSHTLNCAMCVSSPVYEAINHSECQSQCKSAAKDTLTDAASGTVTGVGGIMSALADRNTWLRVGEVVMGLMLLGIGVSIVAKSTTIGRATIKAGKMIK